MEIRFSDLTEKAQDRFYREALFVYFAERYRNDGTVSFDEYEYLADVFLKGDLETLDPKYKFVPKVTDDGENDWYDVYKEIEIEITKIINRAFEYLEVEIS